MIPVDKWTSMTDIPVVVPCVRACHGIHLEQDPLLILGCLDGRLTC